MTLTTGHHCHRGSLLQRVDIYVDYYSASFVCNNDGDKDGNEVFKAVLDGFARFVTKF